MSQSRPSRKKLKLYHRHWSVKRAKENKNSPALRKPYLLLLLCRYKVFTLAIRLCRSRLQRDRDQINKSHETEISLDVLNLDNKTHLQDDRDDNKTSSRRFGGTDAQETDDASKSLSPSPSSTSSSGTSASGSEATSNVGKKPALKIGIVLPKQIFQQRRYQVITTYLPN